MITGKTIALTRQTFVGKVMTLLFNMLSRLVIAFLPRSKCLLITSTTVWSLEKAMAPQSSTLAWKIPRTEEPRGLQFMSLQTVEHD